MWRSWIICEIHKNNSTPLNLERCNKKHHVIRNENNKLKYSFGKKHKKTNAKIKSQENNKNKGKRKFISGKVFLEREGRNKIWNNQLYIASCVVIIFFNIALLLSKERERERTRKTENCCYTYTYSIMHWHIFIKWILRSLRTTFYSD